jgi:hypothetical protein
VTGVALAAAMLSPGVCRAQPKVMIRIERSVIAFIVPPEKLHRSAVM